MISTGSAARRPRLALGKLRRLNGYRRMGQFSVRTPSSMYLEICIICIFLGKTTSGLSTTNNAAGRSNTNITRHSQSRHHANIVVRIFTQESSLMTPITSPARGNTMHCSGAEIQSLRHACAARPACKPGQGLIFFSDCSNESLANSVS